jgi:hypothetical protein
MSDLECRKCADPPATSPHGLPPTPGQAAGEVAEAPFRVWMHEVGHDPDDMRTYYGVGAMAEAFQGGTQAAIAAQEPKPVPAGPGRAAWLKSVELWGPGHAATFDDLPDLERGQWASIVQAGMDGSEYVRELERRAAQEPHAAPELAAAMRETRELRQRVAAVATGLTDRARINHPSKVSQICTDIAASLRRALEGQ